MRAGTYENVGNVVFALLEVPNEFVEVAQQEVFIRKQFLICHQVADALVGDVLVARHDCQGVEVLLSVEEHVKARLLDVGEGEGVGALAEDGTPLEEATHQVQYLLSG